MGLTNNYRWMLTLPQHFTFALNPDRKIIFVSINLSFAEEFLPPHGDGNGDLRCAKANFTWHG